MINLVSWKRKDILVVVKVFRDTQISIIIVTIIRIQKLSSTTDATLPSKL
jgi:hypothetical protein